MRAKSTRRRPRRWDLKTSRTGGPSTVAASSPGRSAGEGSQAQIASSSPRVPTPLSAEPQRAGRAAPASTCLRIAGPRSSGPGSTPSRTRSRRGSSRSARASTSSARSTSASSRAAEVGSASAPGAGSKARVSRSMTPRRRPSSRIACCTRSGRAPSRSRSAARHASGSASGRSHLLRKARVRTPWACICRQTVSDWACTPAPASSTTTPPSSTRMARSTSRVKST